ncbi:Hypothetical protein CINCED_3A004641 [Cinara cedri]|uniref:UMA domain-containing protein n=1 Tax=Cinara cedri TaxID=506608 RepID=A0A5E4N4L1_9HEMI|nr:Hypothetical protein CINCED_3A004641 [Cinara cedri]
MASWLFGVSKLTSDVAEERKDNSKDTQPIQTLNPEPVNNLPATNLLYNLHPTPPKSKMSDENEKPISMLDSIPFVLSSQINVTTDLTCNLDDIRKRLSSVKEILESDLYNYDFSNDRKLVNDVTMCS